jgi:hypothetical protein
MDEVLHDYGKRIGERGDRFLEGDAVLLLVAASLLRVPDLWWKGAPLRFEAAERAVSAERLAVRQGHERAW